MSGVKSGKYSLVEPGSGVTVFSMEGQPTTWITIITDVQGNLITTYPCPAP